MYWMTSMSSRQYQSTGGKAVVQRSRKKENVASVGWRREYIS